MTRHFSAWFLLAGLALSPVIAQAQETKPETLPTWEQLTPAQRELLIAPIRERCDSEPERRPQFMRYAKRWKELPPPQRDHASRGMERWETMSPEQREQARAVFHFVRGMDKDSRRDFMDKWRAMTPQQRSDWAKAHPVPEQKSH